MTEVIAGLAIPETPAAVEATRVVRETTSPLERGEVEELRIRLLALLARLDRTEEEPH